MMEWLYGKWEIIDSLSPFLAQGLLVTFKISIISIFLGSFLGFVLGVLKTLHPFLACPRHKFLPAHSARLTLSGSTLHYLFCFAVNRG